jgi:hypothetical protein
MELFSHLKTIIAFHCDFQGKKYRIYTEKSWLRKTKHSVEIFRGYLKNQGCQMVDFQTKNRKWG